nr:MAG: hypothetical protein [Hubei tick virus 2]
MSSPMEFNMSNKAVKFTVFVEGRGAVKLSFFSFSFETCRWHLVSEERISGASWNLCFEVRAAIRRIFAGWVCDRFMGKGKGSLLRMLYHKGRAFDFDLHVDLTSVKSYFARRGEKKIFFFLKKEISALADSVNARFARFFDYWGLGLQFVNLHFKQVTESYQSRLSTYLRAQAERRAALKRRLAQLRQAKWEAGMARAGARSAAWERKMCRGEARRRVAAVVAEEKRARRAARLAAKQQRRVGRGLRFVQPLEQWERELLLARLHERLEYLSGLRRPALPMAQRVIVEEPDDVICPEPTQKKQWVEKKKKISALYSLGLSRRLLMRVLLRQKELRFSSVMRAWREFASSLCVYDWRAILFVMSSLSCVRLALPQRSSTQSSCNRWRYRHRREIALEKVFARFDALKRSIGSSEPQILPPLLEHQMDKGDSLNVDPVAEPSVQRTSNVASVDQGEKVTVVSEPRHPYPCRMNEGRETRIVSEMANRYMLMRTYSWTTKQYRGQRVVDMNLPKELFTTALLSKSPNMVMLKKWEYLSFDIHVRVQLNATRLQVGQLLFAWSYNFDNKKMSDIFTASQAPHAILSSPGNNVVELVIPFKWKYPYWSRTRINSENKLINLVGMVLVPLQSPDTVSPSCNFNVQVRLESVNVCGMRTPSVAFNRVEHQMFRAILNGAEGLLRQLGADLNRDNPTTPVAQNAMIPYMSHSWCIGTNQVEVTNVLRLDAIATTPHPEPTDEMKISVLSRRFSLLMFGDWKTSNDVEKSLLEIQVGPMCLNNVAIGYPADLTTNKLATYKAPILHVLSSMFAYWRGTIEYRFDFVASMFHTGRVAVCFVPGPKSSDGMKVDLQSYVQYYDLANATSFTYKCPYICDKTWCETRAQTGSISQDEGDNVGIGWLKMYVVNPLVAVTGTSDSIKVVCYVRAGDDFHFAVPCMPTYFPVDLGRSYISPDVTLSAKAGYYPVFAGTWHTWQGGRYYILRYSEVSDQVAQFSPMSDYVTVWLSSDPVVGRFYVWIPPDPKTPESKGRWEIQVKSAYYFVRPQISGQEAYCYLVPFYDLKAARSFAMRQQPSQEFAWVQDTAYVWQKGQRLVAVKQVQHQGDERLDDHIAVEYDMKNCLTSMNSFNEGFDDLKDLCRRYQLYCDFSAEIHKDTPFGATFYRMAVLPCTLKIDFDALSQGNKIAEFLNRVRMGPIGILANGFRYFRGGLRFKILFKEKNNQEIIIGVTHVPDRRSDKDHQVVRARSTNDFVANGYAYICQSAKTNECLEIEIPYYLNSDYGILAHPDDVSEDDKFHCSLGYLAFSIMSRIPQDIDLGVQIYVAFADDMRFSSFQGFSDVATQFQIPISKDSVELRVGSQEGKEPENSPKLSLSDSEPDIIDWGEVLRAEHQMFGLGVRAEIKGGVDDALDAVEGRLPTLFSQIRGECRLAASEAADVIMQKTTAVLNQIKGFMGEAYDNCKVVLIAVASNLVHLYLNPSWKALIVSLAAIYGALFGKSDDGKLTRLATIICQYVNRIIRVQTGAPVPSAPPAEEEETPLRAEHQFEPGPEDHIKFMAEAAATYMSVLASLFNVRNLPKERAPNFLSSLFVGVRDFGMTVNGLTKFIRVNVEIAIRAINFLSRCAGYSGISYYVSDYQDQLKSWCRQASMLTNPLNKCRIDTEPFLQHAVFMAYAQAEELQLALNMSNEYPRLAMQIRDLATKLGALRERLVNECLAPMCRYEPHVIQVNGKPGIGKSVLFQHIAVRLLKAINYTTYSEPVFTRTAGTAYWNGVGTQPALYYDDFLAFRSGPLCDEHVMELMQLKSCGVFNPNIAELENKKVRYNPLMVLLASNACFWRDLTNVSDHAALHRRRDSLWEAELKPGVDMKEVKKNFEKTGIRTFDHLQFRRYRSVLDENSLDDHAVGFEDFMFEICRDFKVYHSKELRMYQQRLKDLDTLMPRTNGLEYDLEAEKEVLEFLNKLNKDRDAMHVDKWREHVRKSCDPSAMTMHGLDPMMKPIRDKQQRTEHQMDPEDQRSLLDQSDEEQGACGGTLQLSSDTQDLAATKEDMDFLESLGKKWYVNDPSDDYNCGATGHRQEVPREFRCIHWLSLTYKHAFMPLVEDHEDEFDGPVTEEDRLPAYRRFDANRGSGRAGWLHIPEACNLRTCWLTTDYSALFRFKWTARHIDIDNPIVWKPKWLKKSLGYDLVEQVIHLQPAAEAKVREIEKKSRFKQFLDILKTALKWIGLIGFGLSAVYGAYNMLKPADHKVDPTAAPEPSSTTVDPWHEVTTDSTAWTTEDPWHLKHQYTPSGDQRSARQKAPKNWAKQAKVRAVAIKAKFAKPQFDSSDPVDNLLTLIKRNAFESCLEIDGQERFKQKGLGLCGRIAITTKHFWETMRFHDQQQKQTKKQVWVVIKTPTSRLKFRPEELKFTIVDESSLALMEFPVSMTMFRDIRRHIVDTDEIAYCSRQGKFIELNGKDWEITNVVYDLVEAVDIGGDENVSPQYLEMCYSYPVAGRGKCGAVLVSMKPTPRIIGLHVAGVPEQNHGFAQAIFKEIFEDLQAIQLSDPPTEHQGLEIKPKIPIPEGVQFIGVVPPEAEVSRPVHSQLIPSLMFDEVYKHETEPAVLRRNDPRCKIDPQVDPLVKAIATHGKVPLAFKQDMLDQCVRDLSDYLLATTRPYLLCQDELLDDQTIFAGIPDGGPLKKLNMSSAEGYPLCLYRQNSTEEHNYFRNVKRDKHQPLNGKNWLFDFDVEQHGVKLREIHPELKDLMAFNDELRKQGIIPATTFVDTLKDARVTLDKVQKGKTRMFSMSPVEYTWAVRKYFGVFQAAYQKYRITNGTAIGINTQGSEWSMLLRELLKKGSNFVVGDYKAFGDTLERSVMKGAFTAICEWYVANFSSSEETQQYREILIEELFNAVHLASNIVYRMHCGIPSGFALTVEINDLVNQLYMRYCWCEITGRPLTEYHRFVKTVTYGDDLIMTVNDQIKETFNFRSIQQCLASYDIEFQPAAKDGSVYDTLSLAEVTFLKCKFVRHPFRPHQFLAELPLSSCLDTINWQYKGNDKIEVLFENTRAAMNNVFGHGPEVYNKWRRAFIIWFGRAAERGIITKSDSFIHIKTWKERDDEVFGDNY